jgi:hypothetical protein
MTFYSFTLFVHIVGVLGMFIAIGLEEAALFRLRAAKTTALVREWMRIMGVLEKMFPITGVLILGAGLYLTFTAWGWSQAWIDTALIAFLLISVLAPTVTTPRFKGIRKAVELTPDEPLPTELSKLTHDSMLRTTIFVMDFLTLGIVCLMTMKPGWIGSLAVMTVAFIVAIIAAQLPQAIAREAQSDLRSSHAETALEKTSVK